MADFSKLMERKAAALKYDSEKNGAPMIVAAGMGHMAEKITETAMKAAVPVYEDDSLASLLTQMKLGAEIPEEEFKDDAGMMIRSVAQIADEAAAAAAEE